MQFSLLINSFVPAHLKNPDIFTPLLTWRSWSENNLNIDVFQMYRDITTVLLVFQVKFVCSFRYVL